MYNDSFLQEVFNACIFLKTSFQIRNYQRLDLRTAFFTNARSQMHKFIKRNLLTVIF